MCITQRPFIYWLPELNNIDPETVFKLWDQQGTIRYDTSQILDIFFDFYSNLYTSSNLEADNIASFLGKYNFKTKLDDIHSTLLEEPILEEEILRSIQKLKRNKSPGFDGFTSNYYKKFSAVLLTPLHLLFNEVLTSGIIPPTKLD